MCRCVNRPTSPTLEALAQPDRVVLPDFSSSPLVYGGLLLLLMLFGRCHSISTESLPMFRSVRDVLRVSTSKACSFSRGTPEKRITCPLFHSIPRSNAVGVDKINMFFRYLHTLTMATIQQTLHHVPCVMRAASPETLEQLKGPRCHITPKNKSQQVTTRLSLSPS